MVNIKKNFAYNIILNISTYIASLIAFPYVSRVLNAELIGTVSFVNQAVQCFVLFSMAGVVAVGTRAIAESGDDRCRRSENYSSVLSISLLVTLLVLLVYLMCALFIPAFSQYKTLFLIGSGHILFSSLLIEWLFRGVEDFKYIAIRNIAIRVLYIVCLFIFVRNEADYTIYFALNVVVVVANAIINVNYSRKHVDFIFSRELFKTQWKKIIKPFVIIGANNIMNSLYSTFNVIYLGIVCSKEQVGYYTISNKIMTICLGVITAFTLTMLPRMSNLAGNNNKEEFNRVLNKSFQVVISLCIPLCVTLFLYAPNIVVILSGTGYEESVLPLRIIAPVVFINAIAQIIVFQVQMPLHQDKAILYATVIAAVVGVSLNFVLVRPYGVVGSAIVLLLSVLSNLLYNIYCTQKKKMLNFPAKNLLTTLLLSIPYVFFYYLIVEFTQNNFFVFIGGGLLSGIYWLIINRAFVAEFIISKRKR